jgi:ribosome-associated toxin RatA of RatAB toxin-antitoxin module
VTPKEVTKQDVKFHDNHIVFQIDFRPAGKFEGTVVTERISMAAEIGMAAFNSNAKHLARRPLRRPND